MVRINFTTAEGEKVAADGSAGESLLTVAQVAGMPLEGTCEGQMACSTCHVVVAPDWFGNLKPATEDEEDMLDLAAGVQGTSRLACQILLDETLDGLEVAIPAHVHNVQR
ncbi:2Fe-2S iron-sulfur cluster-binding protein [Croceicoccus sediminis]|uniref:2Fe-2S iron-sulfur cluster-binding protein n=1 Tax=Croceicoccus sediminis TaxID=2571150 RepID=UPI001182CC8A|nr:2Fe-2S iron-sulfur cluster-binding protein [Croceicoccus sediminis]